MHNEEDITWWLWLLPFLFLIPIIIVCSVYAYNADPAAIVTTSPSFTQHVRGQLSNYTRPNVRAAARACGGEECLCSSGGLANYGRYCGYGYTACNDDYSIPPCDAVDALCQTHDACTGALGARACRCHVAFVHGLECLYLGLVEDGRKLSSGSSWDCNYRIEAIVTMAADIMYVLPQCF